MQTIKIINDNVKKISETNTLLDMLLEFEGVVDNFDLYAYKNWNKGELVEGPVVTKYDTTATFMWDMTEMPDPDAGQRLLNVGGQVAYKKDIKLVPRKIKSYSDYRPGTKKGKLDEMPVWLVKISVPNTVIEDFNVDTKTTQTVSGSQVDQSPQDQVEL